MTVAELIELLSTFEPTLEVNIAVDCEGLVTYDGPATGCGIACRWTFENLTPLPSVVQIRAESKL